MKHSLETMLAKFAELERELWAAKFDHWVKCAEGGEKTTTHQYIKSLGFKDCAKVLKENDRWIPAEAHAILMERCPDWTPETHDFIAQYITKLELCVLSARNDIGPWMSAALSDEKVCPEMKADIKKLFDAIEVCMKYNG